MSKAPIEPRPLVALSPNPRNMPPDWKPPAPAWAISFSQQSTPVIMAYFGTQFAADADQREHRVDDFFDCADAPDIVEGASYADRVGHRTLITSAYWTNPASYERWREKSRFEAWWNEPVRLNESQ